MLLVHAWVHILDTTLPNALSWFVHTETWYLERVKGGDVCECKVWLGSTQVCCTIDVHVYVCILAVDRESLCPGVVLGISPDQETEARCQGQHSSTDKNAISVVVFSFISFLLFSSVVSEGSVC